MLLLETNEVQAETASAAGQGSGDAAFTQQSRANLSHRNLGKAKAPQADTESPILSLRAGPPSGQAVSCRVWAAAELGLSLRLHSNSDWRSPSPFYLTALEPCPSFKLAGKRDKERKIAMPFSSKDTGWEGRARSSASCDSHSC